jgi:hypothetical protein
MKSKEFDNILNDCLERLLIRGESLEQCLDRYPEQAAELKPLLKTALAAREAAAIQPHPDFRAQANRQFRAALEERAAKARPSWGWFPRWATAVAIVLVLVLAGGGTVFAAGGSMPDSPLYPVKLATEQVELTLTLSRLGKARLCAELADKRVAEIAYMADKGDAEQVELTTRRLEDKLDLLVVLVGGSKAANAVMLAPPAPTAPPQTSPPTTTAPPKTEEAPAPATGPHPPVVIPPEEGRGWGGADESAGNGNQALRDRVALDAVSNQVVLNAALDKAPERARAALRRAIMVSEDGYEEVLEALEQQ